MIKNYCDHCGKEIKKQSKVINIRLSTITVFREKTLTYLGLCPKCSAKLLRYLDDYGKVKNE